MFESCRDRQLDQPTNLIIHGFIVHGFLHSPAPARLIRRHATISSDTTNSRHFNQFPKRAICFQQRGCDTPAFERALMIPFADVFTDAERAWREPRTSVQFWREADMSDRASCFGGDGPSRRTLPFSDVSCRGLAQPCSPVTRQITSPTSSATRTEPSGPSVTPTGRP
jgi:hypothetical protein